MKSRACFAQLRGLQIADSLGPHSKIVWQHLESYYDKDMDINKADKDLILNKCVREHERHKDIFTKYFSEIDMAETSPANILADVLDVKRRDLGLKLSAKLVNGESTDDLLEEYLKITKVMPEELIAQTDINAPKVYHLYSPQECLRDMRASIKLSPASLNPFVGGGLHKGNHLVIFARPEGAKSLFAINLAYGFCQQKLKTLYVGNEDSRQQMGERFLNRFTGMVRSDLQQIPPEFVLEDAISNGYDYLYFAPMSPGTPNEIREVLKEYGPFDCLIVDQMRNLNVREEGRTLQLEKAATEVRNIAKQFNVLAVSVTQAGGSAEDKLMLDMGDVDSSKTGIASTADVMIGIGCDDNCRSTNQRMLSFCKNKTPGNQLGNSLIIKINPAISKVEEE
jgi:hypothetical protein